MLLHFIGAAFGSFAVAIAIAAVFAVVLISLLSLPIAEVMIAYRARRAVDAMMVLALALNLDPVYVGAHHLTRIIFRVADHAVYRAALRARTPSKSPDGRPSRRSTRPPFQD